MSGADGRVNLLRIVPAPAFHKPRVRVNLIVPLVIFFFSGPVESVSGSLTVVFPLSLLTGPDEVRVRTSGWGLGLGLGLV